MSLLIPKHLAAARSRASAGASSPVKIAQAERTLADEIAEAIPVGVPRGVWWRVVVTPVGLRSASKGGILLTEHQESDQLWVHGLGKVVSVGSLAFKGDAWKGADESEIPKVGDLVLYNPKTPTRVMRNGRWFLIMNDDHVTSVVDPAHAEGFSFFEGLEI